MEIFNHEVGSKNIELLKIFVTTDRYMSAWIETSCTAKGTIRLRTVSTHSKLENSVSK